MEKLAKKYRDFRDLLEKVPENTGVFIAYYEFFVFYNR